MDLTEDGPYRDAEVWARHLVPIDGTPDRPAVQHMWALAAFGKISREYVHAWAVPRVEGSSNESNDLMVRRGLLYLHGYDLAYDPGAAHITWHGAPGEYSKTLEVVRHELATWRADCGEFDRDPESWKTTRLRAAREAVRRERGPDPAADGPSR